MITKFKNQLGFTLIEMLIVIIILGILAMIIVPQITVSTEDAKLSTLQANLSGIRSAVETYYAQHLNTYPGRNVTSGTGTTGSDGDAATAFVAQLTQYTTEAGLVQTSKDSTFKYGPYIKGGSLGNNPFTSTSTLVCDFNEGVITMRSTSGTGEAWRCFPLTGVFIANDTTEHAAY
jgi:prepilin-type N-terminal cleavage/methylation domain-containing protein